MINLEDRTSKKLIQSYLFTNYGNFFISTIYRMSSAMLEVDSWYYETFAWRLDKDKHRTDWVADNSGAGTVSGAFDQHFEVCRQLELHGEYKEIKSENNKN